MQPPLPSTLEKNSNKKKCRAARKLNTCGVTNPNRCSSRYPQAGYDNVSIDCMHVALILVLLLSNAVPVVGMSCDEYPFASTEEGQLGRSVTRKFPHRLAVMK